MAQFVGREDELNRLHMQLQQGERIAITAISGMGGIGKTELALQYALRYQSDYPGGVCWLFARDQEIATQVVNFARVQLELSLPEGLDLSNQVAYCWRNWPDGNVLVILDDVTDYNAIAPYLPPSDPRFKVLITTRLQLGRSVHSFSIEILEESAALVLLRSLVGEERIGQQLEAAQSLCQWLGYLPLGLELVGRYLDSNPDLSLTQMQQRLQRKRLASPALDYRESGMTAQLGVEAAFQLSWQEVDEPAQRLGCLLSLFALAPIPWSLVEQCYSEQDPEDLEILRDRQLRRLSLVERVGEGSYQLHQLIREFFSNQLEAVLKAEELKQRFCKVMVEVAQGIPQALTLEQMIGVAPTIPHLAEAATIWQNWLPDEDLLWPFVGLGRFYEGQGEYGKAFPWYEQGVNVCRKRLGDEHPSVASSLNNLAGLYHAQGRYTEAEPLFHQALELWRLLDDKHPDVATGFNSLASLYAYQGRYAEAEPLFHQALELRRQLLGDEHPHVAISLNNLAALYRAQGRYAEAEPLFHQALELRRQLLSDEHPHVASSLHSLAELYRIQGRYAEAEPLFHQALELWRQLLGDEHPDMAVSLNNLALLYVSQGRFAKAEPLFHQALELWRRLLGNEHPDIATGLNNLALLYASQRRYLEAEPLYHQALDLWRRLLGDEHPDVAQSLNNLATLYKSQGRYAEAESLYHQALELRQRLLGNEHPDVAQSLNNLALLYYSQGHYTEAEPLYKEALLMYQRLFDDEHPWTKIACQNYEACLQAIQQAEKGS